MGAPTKTASKILVGRPIQDSELEKSRQKRGNKLRPVLLVSEMHEKEEQQRTRVAPKEIIFDPPQQNLMFDYRVHRGSTRVPSMPEPLSPPRKPKVRNDVSDLRSRTPIPQLAVLDHYLEPLPNPDREELDPSPPKRPIPPFAPWPPLPEKETQIWPGDLFWFDDDVEPMLEQLVGRCLEQGYMECQESLTIEAQRAQQENFELIQACELDVWQRMRLAEIRVNEERLRRLDQKKVADVSEACLKSKVELQQIANSFLNTLKAEVFHSLEAKGMFLDPCEEELKALYLPTLVRKMELECNEMINYRLTTQLLVDETVECPMYMERAEEGMDLILGRLLGILDSWICYEDNVGIELEAAEIASERIMQGSVGEVCLVTATSHAVLNGALEATDEAFDTVHRFMENVLDQTREDEQFGSLLSQFQDDR
ncbi:flagellar radial spoke protein 3 [Physcomitrium patens]|uniref:flagellar radial spoke protein 3 n=1 Tax=Physcomitrium patens TaxID=3218 RepID=UPI00024AD033|nr:flagellar radial spoke protein 3-like [Physcomitrium patens]XP_024391825.1 flagellar radial spoke protein 3-like [Physcomitrium patens]|eukprot:XP_024391824.1 flagellar radial spoke protein 3-like [Physcomitrella patens]